jgi:formyltetrahydrofolate synthetase
LHQTGDIHAISAANNLLAAAIDTRMFHEATQRDGPLYDRLTPKGKDGRRVFAPVMLRRLEKLGIEPAVRGQPRARGGAALPAGAKLDPSLDYDPDSLTESERAAFARLDLDAATVTWNRVVDVNDRFLRRVEVGRGPAEKGHERLTGAGPARAPSLSLPLMRIGRVHVHCTMRAPLVLSGCSRARSGLPAPRVTLWRS